jgi:hypothetical protein
VPLIDMLKEAVPAHWLPGSGHRCRRPWQLVAVPRDTASHDYHERLAHDHWARSARLPPVKRSLRTALVEMSLEFLLAVPAAAHVAKDAGDTSTTTEFEDAEYPKAGSPLWHLRFFLSGGGDEVHGSTYAPRSEG